MECAVGDFVGVLVPADGDLGEGGRGAEAGELDHVVADDSAVAGSGEVGDGVVGGRGEIRLGEDEDVRAGPAGQAVHARAALQHVVAVAAIDGVVARAAGDGVVAVVAGDQLGSGAAGVVVDVVARRAAGVGGRSARRDDRDIDGPGGRHVAVGELVGEAVGPGVAGGRRVGDHPSDQLHGPVGIGAHGHAGEAEGVAVRVGVVGQQRRGQDVDRAAGGDRRGVRVGHGGMVGGGDGDGRAG